MQLAAAHARVRRRGVNPLVYWSVRAVFQPFFHVWFRLTRIGREHVPQEGPVIFAANHRSFLDPFVIGALARRPVYYVAKRELFRRPLQAWFLNCLGAFPVDRGHSDGEAIVTAKAILDRGDPLVIFPEGTRVRPGPLGTPKRGVGRLALETGAPVVPIAVMGTEAVRRGWRIRPHRVRLRVGRALRFPLVENPSQRLAAAVTERIWPCIELQWEWLGGMPPLRRVAIIGAGARGTGLAVILARAGIAVELGCRTAAQAAELIRTRHNPQLPGVELPALVRPRSAAELTLGDCDAAAFSVPARALDAALAAHVPTLAPGTGVLVVGRGLAPPSRLPVDVARERAPGRAIACLGGLAGPDEALRNGAALVVASRDRGFARQCQAALRRAGLATERSDDPLAVSLAGCAAEVAGLAACVARPAGPGVAGAAASRVLDEVGAYARGRGSAPQALAGPAGVGQIVATVLDEQAGAARAADLLRGGVPAAEIAARLGADATGVGLVVPLATLLRDGGTRAPTVEALEALVHGQVTADGWTRAVTAAPDRVRQIVAA